MHIACNSKDVIFFKHPDIPLCRIAESASKVKTL